VQLEVQQMKERRITIIIITITRITVTNIIVMTATTKNSRWRPWKITYVRWVASVERHRTGYG